MTWLGSDVFVAVSVARSYSSDSTPSLETSYAVGAALKSKKKKKKKKEVVNSANIKHNQLLASNQLFLKM